MSQSLQQSEVEYLKGRNAVPQSTSSLLLSSSKYLNSARLRDVLMQEALRKSGREFPLTYLVSDAIQAFEELKDHDLIDRLLAEEKAHKPEFATWLDARHLSKFSATELAQHAPGTLGAKVHEFITQSGFAIDFMYLPEPKSDYEYLQKRMAQNHDIEHMVTGFGTNPCGENALMTCNATSWLRYFGAQFAGELCRFNVYLTMVNTLRAGMHYPQVLPVFYEALRYGNEMGSSLKQPLVLMRWENYFDRTIAEIREEINVAGSPDDGAWAWTEEAWQEPA
jgi:ubiquinone biosynthesis protein COQ4